MDAAEKADLIARITKAQSVGATILSNMTAAKKLADAIVPDDTAPAPTPAPPDPAVLPGWTLTFRDEFTGTALDAAKWRARDGDQLSYDLATVRARNVAVRDGHLVITTRREDDKGRAWTTGYVDTIGLFAQRYGRFEARMKLNTTAGDSTGIWPAFWMRPDNGAVTGEIDVVEAWGEPSTRSDYRAGSGTWTLHQDTNHAAGTTKRSGWLTPAGAPRLSDDWHSYAVEWTPTGFVFLLDGKPVQYGTVANTDLGFPASVFDAPFHLRIQTQVGSTYWGQPTPATRQPTDLLVDWVRAYAYKG